MARNVPAPRQSKEAAAIQLVGTEASRPALNFFLPDEIAVGLKAADFTVQEEIELLVSAIRDAPNLFTRLAALKFLNARMKDSLILSGGVQFLTAKEETEVAGGHKKVLQSKTMQLLEGASEVASERMLIEEDIIDVEATVVDKDSEEEEYDSREGHFPPTADVGPGLSGSGEEAGDERSGGDGLDIPPE